MPCTTLTALRCMLQCIYRVNVNNVQIAKIKHIPNGGRAVIELERCGRAAGSHDTVADRSVLNSSTENRF